MSPRWTPPALPREVEAVAVLAPRGGFYAGLVHAVRGGFELPGGKREPGESPAAAAVRETHEEAGLEVCHLELLYVAPAGRHLCAGYLALARGPLRSSREGEAVWLTRAELTDARRASFADWNRALFARLDAFVAAHRG